MSRYLITFGGGSKEYREAARRLGNQAVDVSLFNKVIVFTDESIKGSKEFWDLHGEFVEKNKRGYGYWLWKPYIIKRTLEMMCEGDILVYADAGCEIDVGKRELLSSYLERAKSEEIISGTAGSEIYWTKMDVYVELDVLSSKYVNTAHRIATSIIILKNRKTSELVKRWYELCSNYKLVDDSESVYNNFKYFVQHRHDQSILSLLLKKANILSELEIGDVIELIRTRQGESKLGVVGGGGGGLSQ